MPIPTSHENHTLRTMPAPARVRGARSVVTPGRLTPTALGIARFRVEDDLAPRQRRADLPVRFLREERVVEVQLAELPEPPQPPCGGVGDVGAVEAEIPELRQAT